MTNKYVLLAGNFSREMDAIEEVLEKSKGYKDRLRAAACDSAHMLMVAKFDEFVRQLAIETIGQMLINSSEDYKFPKKIFENIWSELTENELQTLKVGNPEGRTTYSIEQVKNISKLTSNKIKNLIDFSLGKNNDNSFIYDIIDTNTHMYYNNIIKIFKFCIIDICADACECEELKSYFSIPMDKETVAAQLKAELDEFIRHRNRIAHALIQEDFLDPDKLIEKSKLLKIFANALTKVISKKPSLLPKDS